MLRPNFEDPMDTAQQLVDNNITVYVSPGNYIWKQFLENSPIPAYKKLGETIQTPKDWTDLRLYGQHHVIGNGTHARLSSRLYAFESDSGRWYRSRETLVGNNPIVGYLSNKKWYLNEVN